MTPEEHRLLIEARDLAVENAKTLKSIQRSLRASMVVKAIYWAIVIGVTFGAFYLIQPYIDALRGSIGDGTQSIEPFSFGRAIKNIQGIQDLYQE